MITSEDNPLFPRYAERVRMIGLKTPADRTCPICGTVGGFIPLEAE